MSEQWRTDRPDDSTATGVFVFPSMADGRVVSWTSADYARQHWGDPFTHWMPCEYDDDYPAPPRLGEAPARKDGGVDADAVKERSVNSGTSPDLGPVIGYAKAKKEFGEWSANPHHTDTHTVHRDGENLVLVPIVVEPTLAERLDQMSAMIAYQAETISPVLQTDIHRLLIEAAEALEDR